MNTTKPNTNLQIAFIAIILTALIFILLFFYIGFTTRQQSYNDSKLLVKEMSRKAANETENFFTTAFMTARSLAKRGVIYHQLKADRMQVVNMIKSSLLGNQNFLSIWTMWEPNAYDGKDFLYRNSKYADAAGHLSVTFFRYKDSLLMEITEPQDYFDDYYTIPTQSKSEIIIEPYHYVYVGYPYKFYETSVVVPFFINSQIAGVIGIDLDLELLQNKLKQVSLYKTGYLALISNNGEIVSHKDTAFITKNLYKIISSTDTVTPSIIRNGLEHSYETISEFTGQKVFRFFYPIQSGKAENPWSIMVEVPVAEVTVKARHLLYIAFGTLVLGIALIVYLIINIVERRKWEKFILESYNKVEESVRIISESERNYRDIFNSTQEAIFIHDATTGKVIDVNDKVLKMYGYSNKDEIIYNSIGILSASSTPFSDYEASLYFRRTLKEGLQVFEWQAKKFDGTLFWVEVSLTGSVVNGVGRILAVARDITEKKNTAIELEKYRNHLEFLVKERTEELANANHELSKQREELQAALENLQRAQDRLILTEKMASLGILSAGVAHEINNPLNFIYGGVNGLNNYLNDHVKEHSHELSPFIDAIFEGVKRASAIVASMNQYSGRDDVLSDNIDIHKIIDNCMLMLRNLTKNRIDVQLNYTSDPYSLKGSEGKLHRALLNILTNSVQAISDTGVITIKTAVKGRKLSITIADSGCGIEQDKLASIFDPFYTTKDPGEGTGLGLFITYNIIKEFKGTIEFDSKVGIGTTARITLPLNKLL